MLPTLVFFLLTGLPQCKDVDFKAFIGHCDMNGAGSYHIEKWTVDRAKMNEGSCGDRLWGQYICSAVEKCKEGNERRWADEQVFVARRGKGIWVWRDREAINAEHRFCDAHVDGMLFTDWEFVPDGGN